MDKTTLLDLKRLCDDYYTINKDVLADETAGNKLTKYHENYVRINYPEEYKKYKEGK